MPNVSLKPSDHRNDKMPPANGLLHVFLVTENFYFIIWCLWSLRLTIYAHWSRSDILFEGAVHIFL
jgi:hypothetical protein